MEAGTGTPALTGCRVQLGAPLRVSSTPEFTWLGRGELFGAFSEQRKLPAGSQFFQQPLPGG